MLFILNDSTDTGQRPFRHTARLPDLTVLATVTVTEELVLRPLLEYRGRIT